MFSQAFIGSTTSIEALGEKVQASQARQVEQLRERQTLSGALLKSYLVEMRASPDELQEIFRSSQEFKFYQLPNNFFQVYYDSPKNKESQGAFFEVLTDRVGVLYTKDQAQLADSRAAKLTRESPKLDTLHITGQSFMGLWNTVSPKIPSYRFVEIGCRQDQIVSLLTGQDDDLFENTESTSSNLTLRNTVADIDGSLQKLQAAYAAFRAIRHIRLPSRNGGGHAIYSDGKITNRSYSFIEHHEMLTFVAAFYTDILDSTEKLMRSTLDSAAPYSRSPQPKVTPLLYKFSRPLNTKFLARLIKSMFTKKGEVRQHFQLRGRPMKLKSGHFQIYGVDGREHVPINLEITKNHLLALVESSVYPSVIQRLIINLQLYVTPPSEIWLGNCNLLKIAEAAAARANFNQFPEGANQ